MKLGPVEHGASGAWRRTVALEDGRQFVVALFPSGAGAWTGAVARTDQGPAAPAWIGTVPRYATARNVLRAAGVEYLQEAMT